MARAENAVRAPRGTKVVVLDDDPHLAAVVRLWLEADGFETTVFSRVAEMLAATPGSFDVALVDVQLPDGSGLELLDRLAAQDPALVAVMMTAERGIPSVVKAMRAGAFDYLVKPLDEDAVLDAVHRAAQHHASSTAQRALAEEGSAGYRVLPGVIGRGAAMAAVARLVERVARSSVTVCITGETGTGKELVARAVHLGSTRAKGPFVALNCGAIQASLLESELFGHERGAFTGAVATHKGRFEEAHGGTLFLDEVGELGPATQTALLRALQERTVRRVGGTHDVPVDVRIVCATHRDLAEDVRAGRFREDLYYRLVVFPIALPALRERAEDIPALVGHFLALHQREAGQTITRVEADAMAALQAASWPGNVRELEACVLRAMLLVEDGILRRAHLPEGLKVGAGVSVPPAALGASVPPLPIEELERRAILQAMEASGGDVNAATAMLGMSRATLYRRLAKMRPEKK